MKENTHTKISLIEVIFHDNINDGIEEEVLTFVANQQIEDFESYCGFGEMFRKEGEKVF